MIFNDNVTRKRTGARYAEVSIRENDMEGIWGDLKPEVTEADKKKLEIKRLREETREMRREMYENKRAMNIMLGKAKKFKRALQMRRRRTKATRSRGRNYKH